VSNFAKRDNENYEERRIESVAFFIGAGADFVG
jgi:hypothetical protein